LPILNLFKNKSKDSKDNKDNKNDSDNNGKSGVIAENDNAEPSEDENEEEIIAVISAAISAFLKKPVSGFRVVSFKKRGNWKTINN